MTANNFKISSKHVRSILVTRKEHNSTSLQEFQECKISKYIWSTKISCGGYGIQKIKYNEDYEDPTTWRNFVPNPKLISRMKNTRRKEGKCVWYMLLMHAEAGVEEQLSSPCSLHMEPMRRAHCVREFSYLTKKKLFRILTAQRLIGATRVIKREIFKPLFTCYCLCTFSFLFDDIFIQYE